MLKEADSSTLHNSLVKGSQENLQEDAGGANSMPTQAPTEGHKSVIVQSSPDEFSASQGEFSVKTILVHNKGYYNYFLNIIRFFTLPRGVG